LEGEGKGKRKWEREVAFAFARHVWIYMYLWHSRRDCRKCAQRGRAEDAGGRADTNLNRHYCDWYAMVYNCMREFGGSWVGGERDN